MPVPCCSKHVAVSDAQLNPCPADKDSNVLAPFWHTAPYCNHSWTELSQCVPATPSMLSQERVRCKEPSSSVVPEGQ